MRKFAQFYTNCVNLPLLTGDGNTLILDICVPPELHLMQGIVKHLYGNIANEWPGVAVWLKHINVKGRVYLKK